MTSFRKPITSCPNNRARAVAVMLPGWSVEIDGHTYTVDPDRAWERFATSDPADADYDETLALSEIALADARQTVGEYGFGAEDYIEGVRELYRTGQIGFADGRVYFGTPIRDALGRITGVRAFTADEAAEDAVRRDREWRAAHEAGDAR